MSPKPYSARAIGVSALLCSLLFTGCATDKAVSEQTKPLHDQISSLQQDLSSSNKAVLSETREQAASLIARQDSLEKQVAAMQADLQALQDKVKVQDEHARQSDQRLNEQTQSLNEQIKQTDKRVEDLDSATQGVTRQLAANGTRQEVDADALMALSKRVTQDEQLLKDQSKALSDQTGMVKDRLDADSVAQTNSETALDGRLTHVEQRLNDLSALVQEAMAEAAKEIFLANGKEAFTVTLTDDKVLYPQNDPRIAPGDVAKLEDLAQRLSKLGKEYHLDIQGHTDDLSTEDNNYHLGKARAEVVKRYLHDKLGISFNRMSSVSYGATKPLDPYGHNNRRIFIRVLILK
ncbi:MAG: OmpA family protein [Thiobacillaceae bacterium]